MSSDHRIARRLANGADNQGSGDDQIALSFVRHVVLNWRSIKWQMNTVQSALIRGSDVTINNGNVASREIEAKAQIRHSRNEVGFRAQRWKE